MPEKLVRDVPGQAIRAEGGDVRAVCGQELLSLLCCKLVEEADEIADAIKRNYVPETNTLFTDCIFEEIADVAEVLDTLCEVLGLPQQGLAVIKQAKRDKKGGFDQRLVWRKS